MIVVCSGGIGEANGAQSRLPDRNVDHLAVDLARGAFGGGIGLDDTVGVRQLVGCRREHLLDGRDLCGMDGELAAIAEPLGRQGLALQSVGVVNVQERQDRKSTRLNSSHANISYAVFCLKKKTT